MSKKPVGTEGEIIQQPVAQLAGQGEFLLYQTEDAQTRIQVRFQDGGIWLTQAQLAELYQCSPQNITQHIRAIYESRELAEEATCKPYLQVRLERERQVSRSIKHYNLEVVLAVGYRAKSHRGTQLRRWAMEQLKTYLSKGVLLDDERFKRGDDAAYFEELLARIRDIRSSEKVFWRKVLDIYATSIDYDPSTETSQQFFATVQNKMHWAAHGHTAAELIALRADAQAPNMGLTNWAGASKGAPVRKADVGIAKNYLDAEELDTLNRIVTAYIEVAQRLKRLQSSLLAGMDEAIPVLNLSAVVAKTAEIVVQQTIDIPRIAVAPTGEVTTGFHAFKLDVSQLHLQPGRREIVGQMLATHEQFTLAAEAGFREQRPEDIIVHALVDFDDIDYFTHADLLYDLASQMVQHLRGYLSEDETISVLDRDRRLIAREIHAQMMAHFWEEATEYVVQVSRGFTELKPCNYTATAGQTAHHFRETVAETGRIKQMLFGGFARCLYPLQKFDSDTERRFAIILERDALKWLKPAKGQFQIYYKLGIEQPEYIPDFVAETDITILMVETKARADINT